MGTTLKYLVSRIKSPQLYQLSYRPNIAEQFGKERAQEHPANRVVPPVYPTRSSLSRSWLDSGIRRVTGTPEPEVLP